MQYRANGSASRRFSEIASPQRSQAPNPPPSVIFWSAETTSFSSRRSPLPNSNRNSRLYAEVAWSPRSLMESSSGPFPYRTFLPTSSTSRRYFSSNFFLKWVRRSFFITASSSTVSDSRARRAGYHATREKSMTHALDGDERGVTPQTIERVEAARVLEEHVDHHVSVIQQEPATLSAPFRVPWPHVLSSQGHAHRLGDGVGLGRRPRATDHEVVGNSRQALQVQHRNIEGILLERGASGDTHDALGRHGCHHAAPLYR